jgi:hypothetical protein
MCSNKATTTMDKTTTLDKLAPASSLECADRSGHPLESIAFFRRFKPGVFRDLIYTLIWNSAFAAAFTVFFMLFEPEARVARVLWVNFVIANCIGYLIHGGFVLANPLFAAWVWQRGFALRTAYYAAVSLVGVFAGYWLAFTLLSWRDARENVFSAKGAITILLLGLIISAILASIFLAR